MSADNWAICPRCKVEADTHFMRKANEAGAAYGKVPEAEYHRLVAEAGKKPELKESFREDYEQGVRDGKYYVHYHGQCEECGLKHEFKVEQLVNLQQPIDRSQARPKKPYQRLTI